SDGQVSAATRPPTGSGTESAADTRGRRSRGCGLEKELHRQLADALAAGVSDNSKVRVTNVAIRVPELRVVEDAEELSANLEPFGLGQLTIFEKPEVLVIDSWSVEEASVSIRELGGLLESEACDVRIGVR